MPSINYNENFSKEKFVLFLSYDENKDLQTARNYGNTADTKLVLKGNKDRKYN